MSEDPPHDALQAGDQDAWRRVFSAYGPRLIGYARRMLGDAAAAEEIVQDALVSAYRNIGRFDGRASLRSWLFRIVHNRAIDEIRRRRRYVDIGEDPERDFFNARGRWQQPLPDWERNPDAQVEARRLLVRVRAAVDRLPHAHREVLLLKEFQGLEGPEICAALDITPGNLRIRLHRARKALRAAVVDAMMEA